MAEAIARAGVGKGSALAPFVTLACALVATVVIIPVAQRCFAVAGGWTWLAALGPAAQETMFTLLLFGTLLGIAIVGLRIDGRLHGLVGGAVPAMASGGAAIGLFGLLAGAAGAALAGTAHHAGGKAGIAGLVLGTAAILFQSGVEEIYFRGWLQPVLARAWGVRAGLLVAAAAFAALHVVGGARAPLSLCNLFLGGMLFGLLAVRSGGLAAPIAAHAAYNWAEQILLGLDPNPGVGSFGALLDLDLVGSPLWGGSTEGLNASLAMSFALTALIIPVAAWRSGAPGPSRAIPTGGRG